MLRLRTAPPSRDLHHGVVARVSYDFQSCFWRPKKVFGQAFLNRENTNFANLRDPFLRLLGLLWFIFCGQIL
jgi:hypothetical protein